METDSAQRAMLRRREGARERRERRLRAEARIRLQLCRDAERIASHRGGECYKAREGEVREQYYGLRAQKRPLPGTRPAPLSEVAGWQDRVKRHVMEDLGTVCPFVQILDLPVPQVVEKGTDTLRILDLPIAEQVVEVPKISCSPCPSRSPIPEPQPAEQLLEVPTVLSPTRIALQIAEQIVDTPVPRGRGEGRVQGFLPRQSSTATTSSAEERISERIEEQLVDTSPGLGLGQGSSSSAGPADEDFTGGFRIFPHPKKVRSWLRTRVRGCPPVAAHPRLLSWRARPCGTPASGCRSGTATLARRTTLTDVLSALSGSHRLASRWCGSSKGMRRDWSGTGTGTRASLRLTSLLFLLGEQLYRQPRAVFKYWAGGYVPVTMQ